MFVRLEGAAESLGRKRNGLVREALEDWLDERDLESLPSMSPAELAEAQSKVNATLRAHAELAAKDDGKWTDPEPHQAARKALAESPLIQKGSEVDAAAAEEIRRAKIARQARLNKGKS